MSGWVAYPDCLTFDITVPETFRVPDPLWPGIGFLIAFIIGGIIGALLAKFCLKEYLRKRSQDEEEATLIAQGMPLHLRGREINKTYPSLNNQPPGYEMQKPTGSEVDVDKRDGRAGAVTPSAITVDADARMPGLSDALIRQTGESTVAEISQQDVTNFIVLEEQLRIERVDGFIVLVQTFFNKLISANKMTEEDKERIIRELRKKSDDIVEKNASEEALAIAALKNDPKMQKNSSATQTETDKIHSNAVQKMNSELAMLESDVPHLLASVGTLTEDDVDGIMAKLKHQLATREKVVGDETRRQIQTLEERLARRKELAEQNRLTKQAATGTVKAKIQQQSNSLQLLVNNSTITEEQKDQIIEEYEKDLWRVHKASEEERIQQELFLNEKLAKKRRIRLKKLSTQQKKVKDDIKTKLSKSANSSDLKVHNELIIDQHVETDDTINDLDSTEADQLNELAEAARAEFTSQLVEVDDRLAENLVAHTNVDEDDAKKILKLHKAEMKEFERNRLNHQKVMESKLQERLAVRRQKRDESEKEDQAAFHSLKHQQEEMLQKVLHSQADLTEDAAARIMEEHKRNMESVNSQLSISKLRQQKQLEERLAKRKARLAEKQQAQEMSLTEGQMSEKEKEKADREIEDEKLKIKQEHELALAALKQQLEDETRQALAAQELQISQLIGQLEVGQARRKNILAKQDKLIGELENQLANKVGENPKGYTTTTELMQKHYGQVDALTNTLQNTKERQEQALQEKLEQKRLRREAEIREQMKVEAHQEMEKMRGRGAGVASNILLDMMLQQRHEKAMEELEQEMKIELQRSKDKMNEELNAEMMAALTDEGKNFMAEMAANSGLSSEDLTEAMSNAAKSIQANDQTVKKLAKEMRVRVKTAKAGERSGRGGGGYSEY